MERNPKKVLETYVRETNELVILTVGSETLSPPDHPFLCKGKKFLGVSEPTIGTHLLDAEGQVLLVEDFHTYHVGVCGGADT